MIVEAILNGFQTVVSVLLSLLPALPQMSDTIAEGLNYIVDIITSTVGIIAYIYTPAVTIFLFTFLLAILTFDAVYKFVMWVLHKVRG